MSAPVKMGIVGLGRWAKVLTRAAKQSQKLRIVAGYSRSEEKRSAFEKEMGVPAAPDMKSLLSNPELKGIILTVPNEQHLPLAEQVARAGKQVYTE
jgi:predicted dehydrogenase